MRQNVCVLSPQFPSRWTRAVSKHLKHTIMKKTLSQLSFWSLLLCLSLTWTSCTDVELAKAAKGNWTHTQQLTDEDGMPYTETTRYSFNHIDGGDKDGGTFTERTYIKQKGEEDGMAVSYRMSAHVKGEWEFILGDLYMTYDLASLRVNMDDLDFALTEDASYDMRLGMAGVALYEGLTGTDLLDKDGLGEEIANEWYQELYQLYKSENEDETCYQDVEIEGNVMTVGTADGRMTLHRD